MGKTLSKAEIKRRAVETRQTELGLGTFERLCPYELAQIYGVNIVALDDLVAAGCSPEDIAFFPSERPDRWSAAVVPAGTGQFIVENTAHLPQRRRANIAHEMAHVLLEHEFDQVLFSGDNTGGCHNPSNKDQESDAAELGAELLLPSKGALLAARKGMSNEQVADHFDVSVPLAKWRMDATGARIIAARIIRKRGEG